MAILKKTEIILDHQFDPKSCRHTLNGKVNVLHCHHYTSLYSRLADDCGMLDGKKLLTEVAEDTFFDLLTNYFGKHDIASLEDRITIAEQYYAASGMGQMHVIFAGSESGEVELLTSHVDQGWIKKWGTREQPVNYITCGYIAAFFSALFDRPTRAFHVVERECIVSGAKRSLFEIVSR